MTSYGDQPNSIQLSDIDPLEESVKKVVNDTNASPRPAMIDVDNQSLTSPRSFHGEGDGIDSDKDVALEEQRSPRLNGPIEGDVGCNDFRIDDEKRISDQVCGDEELKDVYDVNSTTSSQSLHDTEIEQVSLENKRSEYDAEEKKNRVINAKLLVRVFHDIIGDGDCKTGLTGLPLSESGSENDQEILVTPQRSNLDTSEEGHEVAGGTDDYPRMENKYVDNHGLTGLPLSESGSENDQEPLIIPQKSNFDPSELGHKVAGTENKSEKEIHDHSNEGQGDCDIGQGLKLEENNQSNLETEKMARESCESSNEPDLHNVPNDYPMAGDAVTGMSLTRDDGLVHGQQSDTSNEDQVPSTECGSLLDEQGFVIDPCRHRDLLENQECSQALPGQEARDDSVEGQGDEQVQVVSSVSQERKLEVKQKSNQIISENETKTLESSDDVQMAGDGVTGLCPMIDEGYVEKADSVSSVYRQPSDASFEDQVDFDGEDKFYDVPSTECGSLMSEQGIVTNTPRQDDVLNKKKDDDHFGDDNLTVLPSKECRAVDVEQSSTAFSDKRCLVPVGADGDSKDIISLSTTDRFVDEEIVPIHPKQVNVSQNDGDGDAHTEACPPNKSREETCVQNRDSNSNDNETAPLREQSLNNTEDLTMSNNYRFDKKSDEPTSPTGQEDGNNTANIPPQPDTADDQNFLDDDDYVDADDDNDDDDDGDDLQENINGISSPVDPVKGLASSENLESNPNPLDDEGSNRSFGKLDEAEIKLLKKSLGEIVEDQRDDSAFDIESSQSIGTTLSFASQGMDESVHSERTAPDADNPEIAVAEFDFASVVARCPDIVISAKDRTEKDAQALLTHIISGKQDPCLGPDGPEGLSGDDHEDKNDVIGQPDAENVGSQDTGQEIATDEVNTTLHNTAMPANDIKANIIHVSELSTCAGFGQVAMSSFKKQQRGENNEEKVGVDNDIDCFVGASGKPNDAYSEVGVKQQKDVGCREMDENHKGSYKGVSGGVNESIIDSVGVYYGSHDTNEPEHQALPRDKMADEINRKEMAVSSYSSGNMSKEDSGGCQERENKDGMFDLSNASQDQLKEHENSAVIYRSSSGGKVQEEGDVAQSKKNISMNSTSPLPMVSRSDKKGKAIFLSQLSKGDNLTNLNEAGDEPKKSEVRTPKHVVNTSPECFGMMSGSICPCNSEIYSPDVIRYVRSAEIVPGIKRANLLPGEDKAIISNRNDLDKGRTLKPLILNDQANKPKQNAESKCIEVKNNPARKHASLTNRRPSPRNKKNVPSEILRNSFDKPTTLPDIDSKDKKHPLRGPLAGLPRKPPCSLNFRLRKSAATTKTMTPMPQIQIQKGRQSNPLPKTIRIPLNSVAMDSLRAPVTVPNSLCNKSPEKDHKATPCSPVVSAKSQNSVGEKQTAFKKKIRAKLRPDSSLPKNINANKMKCTRIATENCPESLNVMTCWSSTSSSNTSANTISSLMRDIECDRQEEPMEEKMNECIDRLTDKNEQGVTNETNLKTLGLKRVVGKSPFPDVFPPYLRRPAIEPTRLYAPKKHLKPGASSAEEYHKYKMDLRLSQSLAKIKRGPPTVDCYLDPRLKPRQGRSRFGSQKRGQNNMFVMENIKLVELVGRNKKFPDNDSVQTSFRWP